MEFRKSSRSNDNGLCVEVATPVGDGAYVRDSKDTQGPMLAFGREAWEAFTEGLKANEG